MKKDPIINEMVESLDYNWDMFNVDLNYITSRLEESSKKDIDYKVLKKLFNLLEEKTRHIEAIESLKEKYSKYYKKYQKEREEELNQYLTLFDKIMKNDKKTEKEKYDLILEGLSKRSDLNIYPEMDEWEWLESNKQELAIKKEWVDKEIFKVGQGKLTGFDEEDLIRDNIRNAMNKYIDLFSVFDWVWHHEDNVKDNEVFVDENKTEMKYEMLKYFDSLCEFRDKFRKSKNVPKA